MSDNRGGAAGRAVQRKLACEKQSITTINIRVTLYDCHIVSYWDTVG